MEENKPFMPPPPKELKSMPPPPPPKTDFKPIEQADIQKEEQAKEVDSVRELQKTVADANQADVEKNNKKHQSSGGIKTALYWLGFILSLVAVGVLIFLLIK
ncbi:MAG: hypothetical protein ACI4R8_02950 [Candidatus Caccovivens sp.]